MVGLGPRLTIERVRVGNSLPKAARACALLDPLQYPTDVVCLVVLWRVRYKLSLRDLAEMFLELGVVFTHEAVREWEAQLAPLLSKTLRKHRRGRIGGSW
jgi:putative transposase